MNAAALPELYGGPFDGTPIVHYARCEFIRIREVSRREFLCVYQRDEDDERFQFLGWRAIDDDEDDGEAQFISLEDL